MSRAEAMRFIQAQLPSARITCIDLTGQREWARMRAATANRRWASTLACLVSTAVLMPMIAATAAAAPSHTDFQKCGDIATLTSWDIRAKRVGCHKAKQATGRTIVAPPRGTGSSSSAEADEASSRRAAAWPRADAQRTVGGHSFR